jgi:hypothetical protein
MLPLVIPAEPVPRTAVAMMVRVAARLRKANRRPFLDASANAEAFGVATPASPPLAHRRIARSPAARLAPVEDRQQPRLSQV